MPDREQDEAGPGGPEAGAHCAGRTAATPDQVTIQTGHGPRDLDWTEVQGATVQVEFRRPTAPASGEEG